MAQRLKLQSDLQALIGGSDNVYFQQPPTTGMNYPCIVYTRDNSENKHANNGLYSHTKRYSVTVITRGPDDDLPDKIEALPMCSFDRRFTKDNLYHTAFNLYY